KSQMKKYVFLFLFCCSVAHVKAQTLLSGKVIAGDSGAPLYGASVIIPGTDYQTSTDSAGDFSFKAGQQNFTLLISFKGYNTEKISVQIPLTSPLIIKLTTQVRDLQEVVISTGYQNIPKERATGSFVLVDSTLLNRRVSTNILDKLDGVTSGLLFNKNINGLSNTPAISIRGRSTIFANPNPFIVLDNFPYDGELNNINPNDVESITVLKDAAAASIWGVQAGNGVIVITTKKGRAGSKVNVTFNASTTIADKPDIFYQPQMNSQEYISLEQYLLNKGYYDNTIADGYSAISPAVAIMLQKRNGQISTADSSSAINQLKSQDVRKDLEKYIYRKTINQQYALSLSGGSSNHTYYISAGYDNDLQNITGNSNERLTLNAQHNFKLLKDKLQIAAGVLLTNSNTRTNTQAFTTPYTPYDQLAGAGGTHLSVVTGGGLRKSYTDTAGKGALLDWNYRPLDENQSNQTSKLTDYKLNANATYKLLPSLSIALSYQYEKGIAEDENLDGSNSFYTRNLINSFTQLDPATLTPTLPLPAGAILYSGGNTYSSQYGRLQLNYNHYFGKYNNVSAIAGAEMKDYRSDSRTAALYGYNPADATAIPVDYLTNFPLYYGSGTSMIPDGDGRSYSADRSRSYYINVSDTYRDKYTLSASARRDESNLFGVSANQKGVPLWSAGFLWNLGRERFYHLKGLPELKLRMTYGYNGNLDKATTAYLTAQNLGMVNNWQAPYSTVTNPPNPSLRWERVRNINWGIDFATSKNLISGSLEYYIKTGLDLIGNSPIAPQTGVIRFTGNSADTRTSGVDIIINKNITGNSPLRWQSNLLFSYNKDIITSYKVKQGSDYSIVNSNYLNPLQGYPYSAIFSFPFKGLDNQGKPQGLLNGALSQNYQAIVNSADAGQLVYNGSASPVIFGSFRNTLSYAQFDLSVNIVYKFDYFFRRTGVFSGSNYSYHVSAFDQRWQNPGDEARTNIPALIYPQNSQQDAFFQGSGALVEKADHIRLQDIRLSYHLKNSRNSVFFKNIEIYAYMNNIGILWKATKLNIDPDYVSQPYVNPKSVSVGLSTHF
ncbi:MAG: TonB-dependent Receptor Plug Domain protein, partial [Mucilaginibacter sp.]|nr:TonB-dependent Receptor Plug Domain protein [Mucilaginibacter sp.]